MWNTEPSVTCSELDFQQHVCVCVMYAVPLWSSLQPNTSRFQEVKVFKQLWMDLSQSGAFRSALVQLMAVISQSLLPRKILLITSTGKATIRSYCRHWWIMNTSFWTSMWAGQAVYMTPECWPTQACTTSVRVVTSLTGQQQLATPLSLL